MAVNQLAFLGLFFLSVIFYYLLPEKHQWKFLLFISLVFYWLLGANTFIYIIITALSVTYCTQRMYRIDRILEKRLNNQKIRLTSAEKKEKKKIAKKKKQKWLFAVIILNLGILLLLKYGNFMLDMINPLWELLGKKEIEALRLAAPLGISYYTLQAIGYTLDVYKGKVVPEKNPCKVLLFVSYYLQMTQGPIGRYHELAPQLFGEHQFSYRNLSRGSQRILWGLFKKLVLADNLRILVNQIFDQSMEVSGMTLTMGCIYMVLQMYADFSGYMDIVCGMSEIYGIKLMENFRQPLFSMSLGEYWRRWHISLSSWFRDYIFYPASISKNATHLGKLAGKVFSARIRKIFPVIYAMSIIWVCTGLWHDASWKYILWGTANGVIMIISVVLEPQFSKIKKLLHIQKENKIWQGFCIFRTFMIVSLLKVFPAAETTQESILILKRIFMEFRPLLTYETFFMQIEGYRLVYIAIGVILMIFADVLQTKESVRDQLERRFFLKRWLIYAALIIMILFMGVYDTGIPGGFEYAQF